MNQEYDYGSQFHIDLACRVLEKLLENHEVYNASLAYTSENRAEHLASEAFCIAEAMITQIRSF